MTNRDEEKRRRKRIRDRNYRFRKLSPEKKRVRVAKDVIDQLQAGTLLAGHHGYLNLGDVRNHWPPADLPHKFRDLAKGVLYMYRERADVNLTEVFDEVKCTVCGIGACFVAAVRRNDQVTVGDLVHWGNDGFMREYLSAWFSREQLAMIEAAFEKSLNFNLSGNRQRREQAVKFGLRFDDPTERLIAIMQNIIDNGGTFVP